MVFALLRAVVVLLAVPAIASAAPCHTESRFVGFSANEQGYAETTTLTCSARPGVTDRFTLARVFDSRTGHLQGTFRVDFPQRMAKRGRWLSTSSKTFAALYPTFRNAMRQSAWHKVAHAARFSHKRHSFEGDVIRFRAINDSIESIRVQSTGVCLRAHPTQRLAFVVVVRTLDGDKFDVATIRGGVHEQVGVQVFFAPSGRSLVVRVQRGTDMSTVSTHAVMLNSPLDTTEIGALNMMQWESDAAKRDYKKIGDGQHTDDVDAYIEDTFRL